MPGRYLDLVASFSGRTGGNSDLVDRAAENILNSDLVAGGNSDLVARGKSDLVAGLEGIRIRWPAAAENILNLDFMAGGNSDFVAGLEGIQIQWAGWKEFRFSGPLQRIKS